MAEILCEALSPFNRTRMELKQEYLVKNVGFADTFNRTRMELKRDSRNDAGQDFATFNRTRMELKLV